MEEYSGTVVVVPTLCIRTVPIFGWCSFGDVCVPLMCHFWWEAVPIKSNLGGQPFLGEGRLGVCLVGQVRRPLSGASARLPSPLLFPPPSGSALAPPPPEGSKSAT